MDTDTRLQLLETRNALLDLVSGYAQGFDNHDAELLRSIWHEDAVLDLGDLFGCYRGLDEIMGAAEQFWTGAPYMHHWMANPLVEIDLEGDTATASTALDCLCTYAGVRHVTHRWPLPRPLRAGRRPVAKRSSSARSTCSSSPRCPSGGRPRAARRSRWRPKRTRRPDDGWSEESDGDDDGSDDGRLPQRCEADLELGALG